MRAGIVTRRQLMQLCGAAGATRLCAWAGVDGEDLIPARNAVDHLLLGSADLDRGIAWVERLTGVKAVIGGSHPGVGTRNALLALDGARYLEIIAPDPQQTAYNFHIDVRALAEPRLITWAAATADIDALAAKARGGGFSIFGPQDGSRTRPDGSVLKWRTLGVMNALGQQGVEPVPFFIAWAAGSPHPAQDSPGGCELQSLEVEHPDPAGVSAVLKKLGIEAQVKQAAAPRLAASLKTPQGTVVLT